MYFCLLVFRRNYSGENIPDDWGYCARCGRAAACCISIVIFIRSNRCASVYNVRLS